MNNRKYILLFVVLIIGIIGISCGKKNKALNANSLLNSRSVSTWKSEDSQKNKPFRLKAWQDNYHSCDLELTWRADGSDEIRDENLLIGDYDFKAIDPPNHGKYTIDYPKLTVNDGNYNGKVEFGDYGVVGAGFGQSFSGFYLYWDNGDPQYVINLDDNHLYNDLGTSNINEAVTGFKFEGDYSRFTKLNSDQRNSHGFFEYNFKPMGPTKDGKGDYTIPLINQGDLFVLVPFDYNDKTKTYTKKPEFAQQFKAQCYGPNNIKFEWDSSLSKIKVSWLDAEISDHWDLTMDCNYGTWSEGGKKTITKTDLPQREYTLYWEPTDVPKDTNIIFNATVVDQHGLQETASFSFFVPLTVINCSANNIWFTYKCANNPPKQGDWLFVYLYSQRQYNSNSGNFNVYLWAPENTLIPETPSSSGYPKSCFNIGGRGTNTLPDGITNAGVVTTPSSQYSLDRPEGFENGLTVDKDYGIWTVNNQSILDYEIQLNISKSLIPIHHNGTNGNYNYSDPSTYCSLTIRQPRSFGQSSILDVGGMINNGERVDVWQYGFVATGEANIDKFTDVSDNGYLMNCVYKVEARKGTKVKLGLIPGLAEYADLRNLKLLSGYQSDEDAYNALGTTCSKGFAPYLPVNEISFTVQ